MGYFCYFLGNVVHGLFLQGFNLMFDLRKIWETDEDRSVVRENTWQYGVIVLLMNWVPGIVAAIHIVLFHRFNFY